MKASFFSETMTFHGFDGVRSTQPTLLGLPAVRRRVFYRLGMLAQLTEEGT